MHQFAGFSSQESSDNLPLPGMGGLKKAGDPGMPVTSSFGRFGGGML